MSDISLVVGDVFLMAGTVGAAAIAERGRRQASQARKVAEKHAETATRKLDAIQAQTDSRLDARIKAAVEQVAREHPGMVSDAIATEAVTLLLDALITQAGGDPDELRPRRRGRD